MRDLFAYSLTTEDVRHTTAIVGIGSSLWLPGIRGGLLLLLSGRCLLLSSGAATPGAVATVWIHESFLLLLLLQLALLEG